MNNRDNQPRWFVEDGMVLEQFNDHYEDQCVLTDLVQGLSISTIASKYDWTVEEVLELRRWANIKYC